MSESASVVTARAHALRVDLQRATKDFTEATIRRNELYDDIAIAQAATKESRAEAQSYAKNAAKFEKDAQDLRTEAAKTTGSKAEDLMERAEMLQIQAGVASNKAKVEAQAAERHAAEVAKLTAEEAAQTAQLKKTSAQLPKAEEAIDVLENKARILTESETKEAEAADLDRQAAAARQAGDDTAAAQLSRDAEGARIVAEAGRQNASEMKVDEQPIKELGLGSRPASHPDALIEPDFENLSAVPRAPDVVGDDAMVTAATGEHGTLMSNAGAQADSGPHRELGDGHETPDHEHHVVMPDPPMVVAYAEPLHHDDFASPMKPDEHDEQDSGQHTDDGPPANWTV